MARLYLLAIEDSSVTLEGGNALHSLLMKKKREGRKLRYLSYFCTSQRRQKGGLHIYMTPGKKKHRKKRKEGGAVSSSPPGKRE